MIVLKALKKNHITTKTSPKKLQDRLNEFFDRYPIPTKSHLYRFLGLDWIKSQELKNLNPDIQLLLIEAENLCETNIIEQGFEKDKSFAKYYLDKYHVTPDDVQEQQDYKIEIVLDTGPLHEED